VSEAQVQEALARGGLAVDSVRPAQVDARGSTPFFARGSDGTGYVVKAVGADQRNADLLFKLYRFVVFRDLDDEQPFVSAKRQLEAEALVDLLAEKAGVRSPEVLAIATLEDGTTLLAHRGLDAAGLDSVDPDRLTNDVLDGLWTQVARLHSARIAHRDLRLANTMIDAGGACWLVDFGFAQTSAGDRALARDVAEMLASQSTAVEPRRVVECAIAALGSEAVQRSLPYLTMPGLAGATRASLKATPGRLDQLRLETAAALHSPVPAPHRLARWQRRQHSHR
jgi:undecaprenyl-diphosphatase